VPATSPASNIVSTISLLRGAIGNAGVSAGATTSTLTASPCDDCGDSCLIVVDSCSATALDTSAARVAVSPRAEIWMITVSSGVSAEIDLDRAFAVVWRPRRSMTGLSTTGIDASAA